MSFIKVDINTNPIPEGVLEPKPFTNPSGGGSGGGGPVNFVVGVTTLTDDDSQDIVVPIDAMDFSVLSFNKTYKGGRAGWSMLTIDQILVGAPPTNYQSWELQGVLEIGAEAKIGDKKITPINGQVIQRPHIPIAVQAGFGPTELGISEAKVLVTNKLFWQLLEAPFTQEKLPVTFGNTRFAVFEI